MSEPIQIVTVTISTALGGVSRREAKRQVLETITEDLGPNIEIGRPGHILPFELVKIEARTTSEEELPRP